uniref:Uncharacterized protein n=1 Tax=Anguilla anguilla TaxID=7936 RepID=A0A0E9UVZ9_ANGAN
MHGQTSLLTLSKRQDITESERCGPSAFLRLDFIGTSASW